MAYDAAITNLSAKPSADELIIEVYAHALRYQANHSGWDIYLDLIASDELDRDEIADIIGVTKSRNVAITRVYRFLQPLVAARRDENKAEAELAREIAKAEREAERKAKAEAKAAEKEAAKLAKAA